MNILGIVLGAAMFLVGGRAWADSDHAPAPAQADQTITGEVVDVLCYLSHGDESLGASHMECAKKCISSGLPVALRSDGQLYTLAMANHEPANGKFSEFAGQQVTVQGKVYERDGQRLIAVSKLERAR